jgi:hypothetical protein
MNESATLIHVWDIDPQDEAAGVKSLDEMFGDLVEDPGFVSAKVLQSADRTSIAAVVQMRSVEDRQRIEQEPDVQETLRHLHGAANIVLRLYHEVKAFPA